MNQKLKTVLKTFSNHGVEVLVGLLKERLQDHGSAPSLRSFYPSVSRSVFVGGGYSMCMKDYVKEGSSIRDRPDLRNQV